MRIINVKIAIKIPVPSWEIAWQWGDYHLAASLQKALSDLGSESILQILPEWDDDRDKDCDVVIVFRGLSHYQPKSGHFNMMWNISHPDKVSFEEYEKYDYILIASNPHAKNIKSVVNKPVEAMLQCTDPELFFSEYTEKYHHELLFVGNSRKVSRNSLKYVMPTKYDLGVYGDGWRWRIRKKYRKGNYIPNALLRQAYSSCDILLNDHWEDMQEKGFISNRIFDGFASGAFIISDDVKDMEGTFGDILPIYHNRNEFRDLVDYYMNNPVIRKEKAEKGRAIVLSQHTIAMRAQRILEIINFNLAN